MTLSLRLEASDTHQETGPQHLTEEHTALQTDLLILAPPPRSPSTVSSGKTHCFLFLDVRALCTLSPEETIRLYREKPSEERQVS